MPTSKTQPVIAATEGAQRALILTRAARLFRKKGFERTTVKEIAQACEMLPGSLYYRYKTKEELLVDLMRYGIEDVMQDVLASFEQTEDPSEQLRYCINAHLRALVSDSDLIFVLLFEWRALGGEAQSDIIALRDDYERLWSDILEAMVQEGVLKPDVDLKLLRLVGIGSLNWVATWYDPEGPYDLDQIGGFLWRIIVDALLAGGARGAPS